MINKILTILLLFIFSSCGYQPLYSKKEINKLDVKKIDLLGNKDINNYIVSTLSIKVNPNNYDYIKIIVDSNKSIIETSKDSKGKPESFKMILKVKFLFENKNNFLTERTISKEFSYKNKDNKFDLSLYEEKIEKNLIDKIIEELNIYMNL